MFILLANGSKIDLQNVAVTSRCDSNLISLSQLQETGITFYDDPRAMTLMRNGKVIAKAKKDRNLFTLELVHPGRAMAVTIQAKAMASAGQAHTMTMTGQRQPTHFIGQNKCIHLWHQRLAYVSNAWVVRASKLVDSIDLGLEKKYNPAEMFVDLEKSDADDADNFRDYS